MRTRTDRAIFDIKCISMGLPPLSMGPGVAFDMLKRLTSLERRRVMRKIRKIAKIEINRVADSQKTFLGKERAKKCLEKQANLSSLKERHEKKYVLSRIVLASDYVNYLLREE